MKKGITVPLKWYNSIHKIPEKLHQKTIMNKHNPLNKVEKHKIATQIWYALFVNKKRIEKEIRKWIPIRVAKNIHGINLIKKVIEQ